VELRSRTLPPYTRYPPARQFNETGARPGPL